MKYIFPDYYDKFSCIAGKCKHNCCIGWEIDIDRDTYDYYSEVEGDFGKKLKSGIYHENRCFKLGKGDRCVFLNDNGLCDIILNLGEESLCDICNDHPRFYNFYDDIEETGLGLCCEEVCRIILSRDKTVFTVDGGEIPENEKYAYIDILQNRKIPFEKNRNLPDMNFEETVAFYRNLERLDPAWDAYLDAAEQNKGTYVLPESISRQLAVYFMYRYGNKGVAAHGVGFIEALCGSVSEAPSFEEICEVCRLYSCEVEYSDVNIERILHCIPL